MDPSVFSPPIMQRKGTFICWFRVGFFFFYLIKEFLKQTKPLPSLRKNHTDVFEQQTKKQHCCTDISYEIYDRSQNSVPVEIEILL